MLDSVRAYLALNLEVTFLRKVVALQRALRAVPSLPAVPIAWVSPPNLRIALRSLGDIDAAAVPALEDALRALADGLPSLRVTLGNLVAHPSPTEARMAVLEVTDPGGVLAQLVAQVDQLLESFAIKFDPRPFHAHLTLARLRTPADVTAWFASAGTASLGEARGADLSIFKPEIKAPGSECTTLARVALAIPQPARSQRPSRASRPSQRPRSRADDAAQASQPIPGPPRMPSVEVPSVAPQPTAEPPAPPPSAPRSPVLTTLIDAELPNEDDWK